MVTKDVAPVGTTDLVNYEEFGLDWSDFGLDDLPPAMAYVKAVQNTSGMDGAGEHGGWWWHSDREGAEDEFTKELPVVILSRMNTRALFRTGDQKPICRSETGAHPLKPVENSLLWTLNDFQAKPGGPMVQVPFADAPPLCGLCPFSMFGPNNEAPLCRESDVYLVDRGGGDLAQLRLSGMLLSPMRNFLRNYVQKRKNPIPPFHYRLTLTLERNGDKVTDKKWYDLLLKFAFLPPVEAREYAGLLQRERERFAKSLQDAERVEWESGTEWGDGSQPFTGERAEPVDPDTGEVGVTGTTRPLSDRLAGKVPDAVPGALPID